MSSCTEATKDAFERRRFVTTRFRGRVSTEQWDKVGYSNLANITRDGYAIRVFLNDREQNDCFTADPDEGWICSGALRVVKKGCVEIRLERCSPLS